jgi:hypothetical protein
MTEQHVDVSGAKSRTLYAGKYSNPKVGGCVKRKTRFLFGFVWNKCRAVIVATLQEMRVCF